MDSKESIIDFRELYARYKSDGRVALSYSPIIPVCKETGINIFNEVELIESNQNGYSHGQSYILYLLEKNDINDCVSYKVYIRDYSNDYEKMNRGRAIESDKEYNIDRRLNIPKRFWGFTLNNSETILHQAPLLEKAKQYIDKDYQGTLLFSSVQRGFGKTHIASCVAKQYWIDKGGRSRNYWSGSWSLFNSEVLFLNETSLYYLLRATYKADAPFTEYDIFKWLTEDSVKMLVLDDIYFVGDKTFVREVLSRLVHVRVDENMLPMIVTSNKTLRVMNDIDKSLTSRLLRGLYVNINPEEKTKDLRRR